MTDHRAMIEHLLKSSGVASVQTALRAMDVHMSYHSIDAIRKEMEASGKRTPHKVYAAKDLLGMPLDTEGARRGSAELLRRQIDAGQCFPVQRAAWLERHA